MGLDPYAFRCVLFDMKSWKFRTSALRGKQGQGCMKYMPVVVLCSIGLVDLRSSSKSSDQSQDHGCDARRGTLILESHAANTPGPMFDVLPRPIKCPHLKQ